MRDSNKGMIQILGPEEQGGSYFSIIQLFWNEVSFTLRFGITKQDYFYIKDIVSFRPFENTAVGHYTYFFSGSYSKNTPKEGMATISVRVEQRKMNKQFSFPISNSYIANILWFGQIKDRSIFEPFMISTVDNAE